MLAAELREAWIKSTMVPIYSHLQSLPTVLAAELREAWIKSTMVSNLFTPSEPSRRAAKRLPPNPSALATLSIHGSFRKLSDGCLQPLL